MPKVYCRALFCAHNVGGDLCNAAAIQIAEDLRYGHEQTGCATFISRSFSGSRLSLDNVNYAGLVAQAFDGEHKANPAVCCSVERCDYNREERCLAGSIEIKPEDALCWEDTLCRTYTH